MAGGRPRPFVVLALLCAPLAVWATLAFGFDPIAHEASQPLIHREGGYVGSAACASCHPDQHASWGRTYHRTMTQRATPEAVVGAFDGQTVTLFGASARPFREGERFFIEVPDGAERRVAEVALAVGSRRYQQYFEEVQRGAGRCFKRLPILWHIDAQRWMHLNGVFLEPDDDDWSRHTSIWNENCIFCHNTGPQPGMLNFAARPGPAAKSYDSEVGELGIACEACHGPGATHAQAQRDPLARLAAQRAGAAADIVEPSKLDRERATALCGQCHGQRLPQPQARIEAWMQTGPTFRPGNRLVEHVAPLQRDTPTVLASQPTLFSDRFWGDGTARLSAYELQGVTQSPCYERGKMSCNSCHTMHGGDPRGMVQPRMRGDHACTQCHDEIARDVAAHTKHAPASSGSRCLDCHMPRMVYGILGIHRSHHIEVPDPARDGEAGRPHACTMCHADQTLAWSAQQMNRLWGKGEARWRAPAQRLDGAPLDVPDAIASLLAGDAVQRAVYAHALGAPGLAVEPRAGAFLRVNLLATLFDAYPSVRWLARQSLLALEREAPAEVRSGLVGFDHVAPRKPREAQGHALFAAFARTAPARFAKERAGPFVQPDFTAAMDALVALLNLQSKRPISIGE
jgi:predicted CXXCH cytochrome family protein